MTERKIWQSVKERFGKLSLQRRAEIIAGLSEGSGFLLFARATMTPACYPKDQDFFRGKVGPEGIVDNHLLLNLERLQEKDREFRFIKLKKADILR